MSDAKAAAHYLSTAAEIERQLRRGEKNLPLLELLLRAKKRANDAAISIIEVDASDAAAIRDLQIDIAMFRRLLGDVREVIEIGNEVAATMNEADRIEIEQLIAGLPENEQILAGFTPPPRDT